jgi:hypothetical protein
MESQPNNTFFLPLEPLTPLEPGSDLASTSEPDKSGNYGSYPIHGAGSPKTSHHEDINTSQELVMAERIDPWVDAATRDGDHPEEYPNGKITE